MRKTREGRIRRTEARCGNWPDTHIKVKRVLIPLRHCVRPSFIHSDVPLLFEEVNVR